VLSNIVLGAAEGFQIEDEVVGADPSNIRATGLELPLAVAVKTAV